jgi:hypothetical protein
MRLLMDFLHKGMEKRHCNGKMEKSSPESIKKTGKLL